ncbi:MAG: DUF4388 domain-containing protein [Chloroflexi bacterium]|nr:DUF4388 domain-containing protein [Chloroflexota bacterium]
MGSNPSLNLNGHVDKTDIPALLRLVGKDKVTGELSFIKPNERVDLYFLFGQLYHAKWREVIGLEAVTELLNWRTGSYTFTEGTIPAQASINEDLEKILTGIGDSSSTVKSPASRLGSGPLTNKPASYPRNEKLPTSRPTNSTETNPELGAFDLSTLTGSTTPQTPVTPRPEPRQRLNSVPLPEPTSNDTTPPRLQANASADRSTGGRFDALVAGDVSMVSDRIAPSPPAGGYYRTRSFCLPAGEQMATSLVATGPQLEEELLHLAEVHFTGYVLGSPEVEGYPAVGICLLTGRFIHAFIHGIGGQIIEGEKAYRMTLDQRGNQSTRFYWFYELNPDYMRAAISLLTPPTRYIHLEARIIRFKEMMQILGEENHNGSLRITVAPAPQGSEAATTSTPLAGDCAYLPIRQGKVLGIWTEKNPRLSNDGPLLQRFLTEPNSYLDLHTTVTTVEPGLPLENLVSFNHSESGVVDALPLSVPHEPTPALPSLDDDERQLQMITSIARMESTWTQMQIKDKLDEHTKLLALAGFVNEVLSLGEAVSGQRSIQEMISRSLRQELAPFRTIFQLLDLPQGRINIIKLLKEYELFTRDSEKSGSDFYRETGRGLRTLVRSSFQYYVSLIRQEYVRFECQEIYEVFLQEVVKKM